jgi:hypothetical protein
MGCGGVAPSMLNLGIRDRSVINFTPSPLYPGQKPLLPIAYEGEWAPESVWSGRFEKALPAIGREFPYHIAPVTTSTELSKLPIRFYNTLH